MTTKLKRPPTVWLTQILLAFFALLIFLAVLLNLANRLRSEEPFPVAGVIFLCLVVTFIGVFLLTTFWGLAKRKGYGRWLGVAFLLVFWGLVLMGQLFRPSGPYQYYEYENDAQLVGGIIAAVCINGLLLLLILRLAFSKKVKDFFAPLDPEVSFKSMLP